MKSRKLIGVYTGLLIIAVATMIMLWRLKTMPKAEVFPRDYPGDQRRRNPAAGDRIQSIGVLCGR